MFCKRIFIVGLCFAASSARPHRAREAQSILQHHTANAVRYNSALCHWLRNAPRAAPVRHIGDFPWPQQGKYRSKNQLTGTSETRSPLSLRVIPWARGSRVSVPSTRNAKRWWPCLSSTVSSQERSGACFIGCAAGFHWLKSPTMLTELAWVALQMKVIARSGLW